MVVAVTYRIIPFDPDLILGCNMDQNIAGRIDDVSDVGYHYTIVGESTQSSDTLGQSISIVGNNSSIDNSFPTQTGELTIFITANISDIATNNWLIGGQSTDSKIGFVGSKFFIRIVSGGSSDNTVSANSGLLFLVVTRDQNNKIDLSVNGGSFSRLFSDSAQSGNSTFNRLANDTGTGALLGRLYSVAIYDTAKTIEWVQQEYDRFKLNI